MAYTNETGYPAPSDILDIWIDKRWFKPEHSERGSAVHAAINAHMKGLIPIWRDDHAGYRESFEKISNYFEGTVMSERRLVDKVLCYSGQVDWVGGLSAEACTMLGLQYPTIALSDWKTSASEYKDWPLRVAAYFNLCVANGIHCDVCLLGRIRKDGSQPKLRVYRKDEIRFYFSYFKAALHAWYYFKTNVSFTASKKVLDK